MYSQIFTYGPLGTAEMRVFLFFFPFYLGFFKLQYLLFTIHK